MFVRRVTHALARTDTADRLRSILLPIVAVAAFVQAGFTVNPTAGWATVGVGVLAIDWLLGDDDEDDGEPNLARR